MKKFLSLFVFGIGFLSSVYAASKVIKSDPKPATFVHKEFVLDPLDCKAVYKVADDGGSAECSVQLDIDQTADADLSWDARARLIEWFFVSILNSKTEATVYTQVKN